MSGSFDDKFEKALTKSSFDKKFEDKLGASPEQPTQEESGIVDQVADFLKNSAKETIEHPLETAYDTYVAGGQGLTGGALDELGAIPAVALEKLAGIIPGTDAYKTKEVNEELEKQGFKLPEEPGLMELWRDYQQGAEQEHLRAAERSPVGNVLGQIAGGVLGGLALSGLTAPVYGPQQLLSQVAKNKGAGQAALELLKGGATTGSKFVDMYAKAAPVIAAESALSSQHHLIGPDANLAGVAEDVKGGLTFGTGALVGMTGLTDVALPAVKKAGQAIKEASGDVSDAIGKIITSEGNPRLAQLETVYRMGEELKPHPGSHYARIKSGPDSFPEIEQKQVQGFVDQFLNARKTLGAEIGKSLDDATAAGKVISADPTILNASQELLSTGIKLRPETADIYQNMINGYLKSNSVPNLTLTPTQLKSVLEDIDYSMGAFKGSLDPLDNDTFNRLSKVRKALSEKLKREIPGYQQTNERFEDLGKVFDQIIARNRKAKLKDTYYGEIDDKDLKMYESFEDMLHNKMRVASTAEEGQTNFDNFMTSLEEFQQKELDRLGSGIVQSPVLPSEHVIRDRMTKVSNEINAKKSPLQVTDSRSLMPNIKEWMIGKIPQTAAYSAGWAKTKIGEPIMTKADSFIVKPTLSTGKALYNAPDDALQAFASRLETSKTFSSIGKTLKDALNTGDMWKKNVALFTIMQNPNARLLYGSKDSENEEYVTDKTTEP